MSTKIKGKILAIIFLLNFTSLLSLNAQWARTSGTSDDERAYSIQQTNDGGYIVAGNAGYTWWSGSRPYVDYDFWILKFTSSGEIEWQRTYGIREEYKDDIASSIQQTSDGGYIVAGGAGLIWESGDKEIDYDFLILKLAPTGDIEWHRTYGGSDFEYAYSIQQTGDGGYIIAGETRSFGAGNEKIWVLKLSSDGTIEWQKTYGGDYEDRAYSIQQTGEGGYIVAGSTNSYGEGEQDFLLLKLSSNGEIDPACIFIKESSAEVTDTDTSPADTDITPEVTDITSQDTGISAQDSEALVYSLCSEQHTLSLSASSGGTTNPSPGTYIYDHALRIIISADSYDEHNFSEWSGDVSSPDCGLSITMDSDISIKANFNMIVIEEVWEEVKKTPCFIATAAYGSPLHPSVRILRDFRDKYLMSSRPGRMLVRSYYKYSPFFANFLTKHKVLKADVRISLFPLVAFSYSMVHFGPAITIAVLILIFIPPVCLAWHFRRTFRRQYIKLSAIA